MNAVKIFMGVKRWLCLLQPGSAKCLIGQGGASPPDGDSPQVPLVQIRNSGLVATCSTCAFKCYGKVYQYSLSRGDPLHCLCFVGCMCEITHHFSLVSYFGGV